MPNESLSSPIGNAQNKKDSVALYFLKASTSLFLYNEPKVRSRVTSKLDLADQSGDDQDGPKEGREGSLPADLLAEYLKTTKSTKPVTSSKEVDSRFAIFEESETQYIKSSLKFVAFPFALEQKAD